jgi:hypothetical protein
MGRIIPFGSIPDSQVYPADIYRLKVERIEEVTTKPKDGKKEKFMYRLTSAIVEPTAFKGQRFTEWFVIGSEEDPEATQLATWQASIGGRQLKRLAKKIGIPFGDEEDSDKFCHLIVGQEYLITLNQTTNDGSKQPNRKGLPENNVAAYWSLGEKDPGSLSTGSAPVGANGSTKPAARLAATAARKAPPSDVVKCASCKEDVPRTTLAAHVNQHLAEMSQMQAPGAAAAADDE